MEKEIAKKAVIADANWLNKVLWSGTLMASLIVLSRILSVPQFKLLSTINLPLEHSWIVIGIFTIAHLYTMILFRKSVRRFWILSEFEVYKPVFDELTTTGGIFMRGMIPRLLTEGGGAAKMDSRKDISSIVSHIAAILIFFSIVPYEFNFSLMTGIAIFMMYLNWMIGSQWAILLSELAVKKENSFLISGKKRISGSKLKKQNIDNGISLIDFTLEQLEKHNLEVVKYNLERVKKKIQSDKEQNFKKILKDFE